MKRLRFAVRLSSRIGVVAIVGAFVTVVGLQYARMIGKNLALASELRSTQTEIRSLEAKRGEQNRTIRRLSDPAGAIPEIHERLHLVRDREAIIYLQRHDDRP